VDTVYVWSTSVNVLMSYPAHKMTDRQTDKQTDKHHQQRSHNSVLAE